MADHTPSRADEIKAIHKEYKFVYQIMGGSLLVAIGVLIGAIAFSSDLDRSAYFINLYTSLLSILVTVFVIDFLNRRREDQREIRQLQRQLVFNAASISNETAKDAVLQIRRLGWLEGDKGILQGLNLGHPHLEGAFLYGANLTGSNLAFANMKGANLGVANMKGASLSHAHLERSFLTGTHLEGANLNWTYLEGADLTEAHLEGADLMGAHLEGANLFGAYLQGAKIKRNHTKAHMDEATILPDGSHWTPATDLTKFGCIIE